MSGFGGGEVKFMSPTPSIRRITEMEGGPSTGGQGLSGGRNNGCRDSHKTPGIINADRPALRTALEEER